MKTFEQWYRAFTESNEENIPIAKASTSIEAETATINPSINSTEVASDDSHSKLMKDCDDIINSLKTLSGKLTESEDTEEGLINESNPMTAVLMSDPIIMGAIIGLTAITGAVIGTTKAAVDGKRNKKIAKEADKDFDKLKKLRLQEVKVESAVEELKKRKKELISGSMDEADVKDKPSKGAVDAKKKEALSKMKAKLDIQIENLGSKQANLKEAGDEFKTGLDTKYGPEKVYGFFSGKVKNLIAQKRDEILQAVTEYKLKHLADKMDPEVKQDLNNKLQKLKADQKKRLTQLKNEQEAEAEKLAKAREEDPAVAKEYEENKDKLEGKEEEKPEEIESTEEEPTKEPSTETPDNEEDDDFDAFGVDNEEEDEEPEVDKTDNSKEGMTKRVDAVIKKAEESGDEEKIKKAKELKDKILAKESWQIEDTRLGSILESELRKMEMTSLIKESISLKDRFSKLI